MKIVTAEQLEGHDHAAIRGGFEGAIGSGAVAGAGFWWLNKRWAGYRSLPPSLKALGMVLIIAPVISIQAERRGLEYDESHWSGFGQIERDRLKREKDERWNAYATKDKIGHWAEDHQYSIILASWAAAVAVSGTIISRNRFQTTAQKVVQVRMWAQGLTVGIMIVAGALTQTKRATSLRNAGKNQDHSWANILDAQAQEAEELRISALEKQPEIYSGDKAHA